MNGVDDIRLGTVGKPLEGARLSVDAQGEIWIKSEAVAGGYYQDAAKTKSAFSARGYKTGDIGEIDEEGYVHIKGRDVFKIVLASGEKVFVEDLEFKILQDARIKETCALGLQEADGDMVFAYFILKESCHDSLKNIVNDLNAHFESKQQIVRYALWPAEDFPRTPTLKIDRKQVSEVAHKRLSAAAVTSGAQQKTDIGDITDVISRASGAKKDAIRDRDILSADLKMDSLSRVELVSLAEEYLGVLIDEAKIDARTTVADIKKLAQSAETIQTVVLPRWQFTKPARVVRAALLKFLLIPVHRAIIKIHYPQKNLPQIIPGAVVIFNHPGVADGLCIARTLMDQHISTYVLNATASVWQVNSKFARVLELLFAAVPLYESGYKFIKVMQLNADLRDKKFNILFAPQGKNQRSEREDSFLPGIGYMIKELDCPVQIIKIKGYREIWPAPEKNVLDSSWKDLLPKKQGTAQVIISNLIRQKWSAMSAPQITALLQKIFTSM